MTTMNTTTTYGAQAIAEDLENLGEEIATDTERTLDEMEEMIDRAASEADGYDEEAEEDRYETYWE